MIAIPPHTTFSKTRLAPTPSGYLHLGNVYSFVLTTQLAQRTGASVLLRIDDMDRDRVQPEYVQDIFDTLRFLNIPWQDGPTDLESYQSKYAQHHRIPLYTAALEQLRATGLVYACTCSRGQLQQQSGGVYTGTCRHKGLPLDMPGAAWRLNTSNAGTQTVKELSGTTIAAHYPTAMHDFVVRKKDGYPAYQLTSVVDDQHYGIDLVVRGADLWHSTLAQLYLSSHLPGNTFGNTTFYHHPLVMADGQKLSKSAGATSIQYLRRHHNAGEILAMAGVDVAQMS